jgi:hypothetical protein
VLVILLAVFLLLFGGIGLALSLDKGRDTLGATVIKRYVIDLRPEPGGSPIPFEKVEVRLDDGTIERLELSGLYRALGPHAAGKRVEVERQTSDQAVTRVRYGDRWYGTGGSVAGTVVAAIILLLGLVAGYFGVRRLRPRPG